MLFPPLQKLFGIQMAQFRVVLEAAWSKTSGFEAFEVNDEESATME